MTVLVCLLLLMLGSSIADTDDNDNNSEKIWSITNSSARYLCGSDLKQVVLCEKDELKVQICHCVHYEVELNQTVAGNCMFTCYRNTYGHNSAYHRVNRYSKQNATSLNRDVCPTHLHRVGRFCGQCEDKYGLAAYSYHFTSCIPCDDDHGYKKWLRYFAVALLPLTVFYCLVVVLQINIVSSRFNGIVFVIQCILPPVILREIEGWMYEANYTSHHKIISTFVRIFLSIAGVFNLDFFRLLYPHFCLHPSLNILHISSLDFIVSLYPFVLIFLTYVLVTLYDKDYRILVWAWKPFKHCLKFYRRQFNVKASLSHTFATFITLSSVKILGVCFDILTYTNVYTASGTKLKQQFLYYDANIEFFGPEHLPFAVLALFVGFVFVFLPFLLLVLYPCGCFQQCLSKLKLGGPALHIFMDIFQGPYRTEPRDLRYFSAYYLFIRFCVLALLITLSSISSFFFIGFASVIAACILAAFQPYKNHFHNKLDQISILTAGCLSIGVYATIMASVFDFYMLGTVSVFNVHGYLDLNILWIAFFSLVRCVFSIPVQGQSPIIKSFGRA